MLRVRASGPAPRAVRSTSDLAGSGRSAPVAGQRRLAVSSAARGAGTSAGPKSRRFRVATYTISRSRSTPARAMLRVRSAATPGAILDIDHDDLALAGDGRMGDPQQVLRARGVRHEDVELRPLGLPDARDRCDVHAGIAAPGRDVRQRPRSVLDVDDQLDCHVPPAMPADAVATPSRSSSEASPSQAPSAMPRCCFARYAAAPRPDDSVQTSRRTHGARRSRAGGRART